MKTTATTRRATARPTAKTAKKTPHASRAPLTSIQCLHLSWALDNLSLQMQRRRGLAAINAGNIIGQAACDLGNLAHDIQKSEVKKGGAS